MREWLRTEDWWAVWVGLFVFGLSLGVLAGADLLGWGIDTRVWPDLAHLSGGMAPVSAGAAYQPVASPYKGLPGPLSLACTYLFLLVVLSVGAWALRLNLPRFALGFTVIFWISYGCWLTGHYVY